MKGLEELKKMIEEQKQLTEDINIKKEKVVSDELARYGFKVGDKLKNKNDGKVAFLKKAYISFSYGGRGGKINTSWNKVKKDGTASINETWDFEFNPDLENLEKADV